MVFTTSDRSPQKNYGSSISMLKPWSFRHFTRDSALPRSEPWPAAPRSSRCPCLRSPRSAAIVPSTPMAIPPGGWPGQWSRWQVTRNCGENSGTGAGQGWSCSAGKNRPADRLLSQGRPAPVGSFARYAAPPAPGHTLLAGCDAASSGPSASRSTSPDRDTPYARNQGVLEIIELRRPATHRPGDQASGVPTRSHPTLSSGSMSRSRFVRTSGLSRTCPLVPGCPYTTLSTWYLRITTRRMNMNGIVHADFQESGRTLKRA